MSAAPDRTTPARDARLLEADSLATAYPGARVPALASVTFSAPAGSSIAVLGPNGGGKSTLFRVLSGELMPTYGTLRLPPGGIALVPQTERSRLDFPVSALDVALMGALPRLRWYARPRRAERARAAAALAQVGLTDEARSTFGDLSAGQRQRVLVARALVQDAPVLLLDEPFSGLDVTSAARLERLISELTHAGRTILLATHDLEQARAADLVLCLNRVQLAFGPPSEALTPEVIERTYGPAMVELGEGHALIPPHHHDDGSEAP